MIHSCKSDKDLRKILEADSALVFKHSTSCGISADACDEMKLFDHRPHDVPVFKVRVIEERSLSDRIAEHLAVRHESPQLIFVQRGKAVWHLSHHAITVEAILEKLNHES